MEMPATSEAAIHLLSEKAFSATEPALCLNEVEEEHAGELEKREVMPVVFGHGARKGCGYMVECGAKLPKESAA
jgi:hypothetical protein